MLLESFLGEEGPTEVRKLVYSGTLSGGGIYEPDLALAEDIIDVLDTASWFCLPL